MKSLKLLFIVLSGSFIIAFLISCASDKKKKGSSRGNESSDFYIGWSSADITPDQPVLLQGQFHARISEGTMDPITVTVLALESTKDKSSSAKAIMISCDLAIISDDLRDEVRERLKKLLPDIGPAQVVMNATHTHTAPQYSIKRDLLKDPLPEFSGGSDIENIYGIDLDAMPFSDCKEFICGQIVKTAEQAWKNRKPGGISFGLGHAVVGHNRLEVDFSGKSVMYGNTNRPEFSHIEGYEDHSVNLLYTWDQKSKLTGIIVNLSCTSQVSEGEYLISADYWHDTRLEIRQKIGNDVYILPQCSASGDQSPHILVDQKAEERMQRIMGPAGIKTGKYSPGLRKQIAMRIADAVSNVFPYMQDNIDWNPQFEHRMEIVELSRRLIGVKDVNDALKEAEELKKQYKILLSGIKENPGIKEKPRWYSNITSTYIRMMRGYRVKDRYELEKVQPKMPVEIHVLRIGDVVIATNPFELYLDYGIRIKARSPAVQTFLVELTGSGTYLPPARSTAGGSYGAVPASTQIGPEGGQELVEKTLQLINSVWQKN